MKHVIISVVLCIVVLVTVIFAGPHFAGPKSVSLTFKAVVGADPLVFEETLYPSPSSDDRFKVSAFRFFISNIQLEGDGERFSVPNSYHLARFDGPDGLYTINIPEVPLTEIDRITFSIGVDAAANTSIESVGDLDPNSRMAWNWEVGYKFVLMEGTLQSGEQLQPIVYHIGFDENIRPLAFSAERDLSSSETNIFAFEADLLKLFNGNTQINLAKKTSVVFDKVDARIIADNYASMISLKN